MPRLESSAARYGVVEEWFMEEQGTFVPIVPVVEVCAVRQMETLQRAVAPDGVLYGVRCVRAALATVRT